MMMTTMAVTTSIDLPCGTGVFVFLLRALLLFPRGNLGKGYHSLSLGLMLYICSVWILSSEYTTSLLPVASSMVL